MLFTHFGEKLAIFIDDIPSDVRLQIERQAFAKDKFLEAAGRDAHAGPHRSERGRVDLTIADADNDEVYLDVPGYENYFAEDALPL